jgi:hypothetical protein
MVQISRQIPSVEIIVHDALEWYEDLRTEWETQDFFDSIDMDLQEVFEGDIYNWYKNYLYGMSSVNDCNWDGDDCVLEVDADEADDVEKAIQKITKISDFSDVVAFVLDNEDGFCCIASVGSDGEILGTLPFDKDDSDEDEDEEDEDESEEDEDEEKPSENDFVDFLSPPMASAPRNTGPVQKLMPRRIGQFEQAAIDVLAWLGNKFQIKTEDRRTQ